MFPTFHHNPKMHVIISISGAVSAPESGPERGEEWDMWAVLWSSGLRFLAALVTEAQPAAGAAPGQIYSQIFGLSLPLCGVQRIAQGIFSGPRFRPGDVSPHRNQPGCKSEICWGKIENVKNSPSETSK